MKIINTNKFKKSATVIGILLLIVLIISATLVLVFRKPEKAITYEQENLELSLVLLDTQSYTVTSEPDNFLYYSYFSNFDPSTFATWSFWTEPKEQGENNIDEPRNFPYVETSNLDVDYQNEILIISYGRKMVSLTIDEEDVEALTNGKNEGLNMAYPRLIGVMGKEYYPNTAFIYKTKRIDFVDALPEDLYDRWRVIEA